MCGRFQMTKEAFAATRQIAKMPSFIQDELPLGMIYPSNPSLILRDEDSLLEGDLKNFGIVKEFSGRKKRLINARAETALDKWSFRYSLQHRRCLIPAAWFYEWDANKQMISFDEKDHPVLYMAGFFEDDGFIILTTAANASMNDYHHRMPLILPDSRLEDWIYDSRATASLLKTKPAMLEHHFIHA